MPINDTLQERGSRYGNFLQQTKIIAGIVGIMRENGLDDLETDQQESLHQIAVKISRILNGDPDYPDNWRDISGYGTLVGDRLEGTETDYV